MQKELSYRSPRGIAPLVMTQDGVKGYADLARLGIALDERTVRKMMAGLGMDEAMAMDSALQGLITTGSVATPVQFLQNWLPGFVETITQVRNIDQLVGITTAGAWEDEEVVQGIAEPTGKARPYGDITGTVLASWNINFERRTVVRYENGIKIGRLEEARASRMNANSAQYKREGAATSLEIARNGIGFLGFNSGANRTYGFLNDPGLPGYVTVANPGSGTTWAVKTMLQIIADIRTAVAALITQSGANIDPSKVPTTLALPSAIVPYLGVTSDFGYSVSKFLADTYPQMRVVTAPELSAANGGANVFYLYAESVMDSGSDDRRTFVQVVPTKFNVLGVQQQTKGYEEAYTNATAGVMCKRPYAVVRYSGI
jgi:hypothetical protein